VTDILAGIRVVEVSEHGMVPAAGAVLADWGADVVKVNHPVRGGASRGIWVGATEPGQTVGRGGSFE
jgi:crotonobetainyl-CoA:carnitine CoA-transferase CaiB-like acyl-CoA transferase